MTHYIFGPVISRRFGVSLGIDLSPDVKRCNFDCLYCELSPKPAQEHSNAPVDLNEILHQLDQALLHHPHVDVITLTANGEPTMFKGFHKLVMALLELPNRKRLLVLSNAARIVDEETFNTLLKLDIVKLSLDALTPSVFEKIDRPHTSIDIEMIKEGIRKFSRVFEGDLVIEILFVKGINDTIEEVSKLNDFLTSIDLFRIDIGTVDRPPAYGVEAVSSERLHEIASWFAPHLPIHIASHTAKEVAKSYFTPEEITLTLDKRPMTLQDTQNLFDQTSLLHLKTLIEQGVVTRVYENFEHFYVLSKNLHKKRPKA